MKVILLFKLWRKIKKKLNYLFKIYIMIKVKNEKYMNKYENRRIQNQISIYIFFNIEIQHKRIKLSYSFILI